MPPQQSDRPLDIFNQIFRFSAHGSFDWIAFDRRDLATAWLGCNRAFRLAAIWREASGVNGQATSGQH
jgi:hypothetical protein